MDAAEKLGMSDLDLRYLEEGVESPKIGELRNMAKLYKRPLAVFLLPASPRNFRPMEDFRLLPQGRTQPYSRDLWLAFRRAHLQREVAKSLSAIAFLAL